jgi:integrase
MPITPSGSGVMACLSKERNESYRIHWKFKAKLGPRAGETFEGSLHLGRCTKTSAKAKQREIEEWEDRVKTGRFVPDRNAEEVFKLWLRERELTCTPQTLERSERVLARFRKWREEQGLPCATVEQLAVREDIIRWRDFRLDKEAGRKTVANDLANLSAFFQWCMLEKYLVDNPVARVSRPRFITKKEGTPLTRIQAGQWLRSILPRQGKTGGSGPRIFDEVRRKRQIIVFLLNTGLRNGELCALDVEDLRIDGGGDPIPTA